MKYLLLNPAEHFREVVDDARSVVLAGGTLAPVRYGSFYRRLLYRLVRLVRQIGDFVDQLFSYAAERVSSLSCDHIVPRDHVLSCAVGVGPRGGKLEFTFQSRGDKAMVSLVAGTHISSQTINRSLA
jgi:chromosome transmission fidelity protein 1